MPFGARPASFIAIAPGTPGWRAAGTFLAEYGAAPRPAKPSASPSRHPPVRTPDRAGPFVYTLVVVSSCRPFLRLGRRHRPGLHRAGQAGGAHDRRDAAARAPQMRRGGAVAGARAREGHGRCCTALPGIHRRCWRWVRITGETAAALHPALNNQFWSHDLAAPMASVPVVVFQYAMSPHDSACWPAGAFVVTPVRAGHQFVVRAVLARKKVSTTELNLAVALNARHLGVQPDAATAIQRARLDFTTPALHAPQGIIYASLSARSPPLVGPFRLGEIHPAAHLQPHLLHLPQLEARGEGVAGRREIIPRPGLSA